MVDENSCIAFFKTPRQAEDALLQLLQNAAFDYKKFSIVGKGYQQQACPVGVYNSNDRFKFWGAQGAFWDSVWDQSAGAALFWIPGLGPVVLAGPLVVALVGALEGSVSVSGLSALGVAFYSFGIPSDSIIRYEVAIKSDQYLIIVHGCQKEVERAHEVLAGREATDVAIHLS